MKSFSTLAFIALAATAANAATFTNSQLTCAASSLSSCDGVTNFQDASCACSDTFQQSVKVCLYQGGSGSDVSTWFSAIAEACSASGSSSAAVSSVASGSSSSTTGAAAVTTSVAAAGTSAAASVASDVTSVAAAATSSPASAGFSQTGLSYGLGAVAVGAVVGSALF